MPPADLRLGPDEVHVWRGRQDLPREAVERLAATLSDDERARAWRFVTRQLTDHFIAARGMLRAVLASYLRTDPAALAFLYGEHGKPALADDGPLRFNLSHSRGVALLAVAWGRELGVDVEGIREDVLRERIADRFFSPREVAALNALPEAEQAAGFFNCWTRKEAYIKALGSGLYVPLDRFDVTLAPSDDAALLEDRGSQDLARWSLQAIEVGPGYAGALVVQGHGWRSLGWDWHTGSDGFRG